MSSGARLAVDIGGTFTDVVLEHTGGQDQLKVLTTPDAPERAVLEGAAAVLAQANVPASAVTLVFHGTTLATNALIERKGAKTALVTTDGFRDSIEIGRLVPELRPTPDEHYGLPFLREIDSRFRAR